MRPENRNSQWKKAAPALSLLAAAGLTVLMLPELSAQPSGGPRPLGRQSRPGQVQPGQPQAAPQAGERMPANEPGKPVAPVREVPVDGKVLRMEEALRAPARAGNEQPSLEEARRLRPAEVGGQKGRLALEVPATSHLHLVLRVTENGATEVVSAAEVPGPAPLTDEPVSAFVYEVTEGERTVAAEAVPDPFEMRAFGPPGSSKGHHFERAKTGTVVVKVPQVKLDSGLERVSVRLHKLNAGPPVERIDVATLGRLKRENRLQPVTSLPAARLAPEVRQRAVPLERVLRPQE